MPLTARQMSHFAHVQVGDGQCGCTSVLVQFPHAPGIRSSSSSASGGITGLPDEVRRGKFFIGRFPAHGDERCPCFLCDLHGGVEGDDQAVNNRQGHLKLREPCAERERPTRDREKVASDGEHERSPAGCGGEFHAQRPEISHAVTLAEIGLSPTIAATILLGLILLIIVGAPALIRQ